MPVFGISERAAGFDLKAGLMRYPAVAIADIDGNVWAELLHPARSSSSRRRAGGASQSHPTASGKSLVRLIFISRLSSGEQTCGNNPSTRDNKNDCHGENHCHESTRFVREAVEIMRSMMDPNARWARQPGSQDTAQSSLTFFRCDERMTLFKARHTSSIGDAPITRLRNIAWALASLKRQLLSPAG